MALIFPPGQQFFNSNGKPVASGTVTFFDSGTTNLRPIYSDVEMTVSAANPVVLDASGRMPANVYGEGLYTVVVRTSAGAVVWSRDNVFSASGSLDSESILFPNAVEVIEVDVGAGGDFATINEAITHLRQRYAQRGGFMRGVITLLSGFVMQEEVHVIHNTNLGWITIRSVDEEVTINRGSLTTYIGNTYNGAARDTKPSANLPQNSGVAFFGWNGSVIPRINVLFTMNTTGDDDKHYYGIMLHGGSHAEIGWGCGIKNVVKPSGAGRTGRGINVAHGSTATGWGSVWSGCEIGMRVSNASKANFRYCVATGCKNALAISGVSECAIQNSVLTGASQHAIIALNGSRVHAREADCSNAGSEDSEITKNRAAIYVDGAHVEASGANCSSSGRGVHAQNNATVNFENGIITASRGLGIHCINGSRVAAVGCTVTGTLSASAVGCEFGSLVDVSNASIINNSLSSGLNAVSGTIHARDATITGNKLTGADRDIRISRGGIVHAHGAATTNGSGSIALSDTSVSVPNQMTANGVLYCEIPSPIHFGTATPEGAVTAPVGTLFLRLDGGTSTTLYIKETGTGDTGWVAK